MLYDLSGFIKNVDVFHVFYKAIFMPFCGYKPGFKEDRKYVNACV